MAPTGYDPDIPLKGGWTALMYACNHGNHDIIQFLLDKGANTNSHKGITTCHAIYFKFFRYVFLLNGTMLLKKI